MRLALVLVATALAACAVNFVAATGGHCGDYGCSSFPEWLYVSSGWLVLLCLVALLLVLGSSAARRLRR